MDQDILREVIGTPGFSSRLMLSEDDLTLLRQLIQRQWRARIAQVHPELAQRAQQLGIARYHELDADVQHEALWPKEYRILDRSAVAQIKGARFFMDLHRVFGDFSIAEGFHGNVHIAGLEEIYWRLVRPGAPTDVGPLHADHWFHQMLEMQGRAFPRDAFTLKLWIPIYSEPGRNGLLLVPDSHRKNWKYSVAWVNGQPKPRFEDDAEPILVPTAPGNALLFHERTLHGGALNRGESTRVSAEITLVFPSAQTLLLALQ